jgi:hypothetical protein
MPGLLFSEILSEGQYFATTGCAQLNFQTNDVVIVCT